MDKGKLNWVFSDGDLPPKDGGALEAHEALMVVNLNEEPAHLKVELLFEDREPQTDLTYTLSGRRVHCFRLDEAAFDQQYRIPFGQYALHLESDVPVVAVFGRLDTRQANMAYYAVQGYSF